jgi:dTDP-4-dehydrorhamnose reductase
LRTSWVFGIQGNNFVKTILRLAAEREELTIVNDQYGCPTYAGDIAKAILCIIQRYTSGLPLDWGVYHCVGEGAVSWCEFSQVIVDEAYACGFISKKPAIVPISTSDYPTPAARPAYSVLNTGKLNLLFDHKMTSWRKGLTTFLSAYAPPS